MDHRKSSKLDLESAFRKIMRYPAVACVLLALRMTAHAQLLVPGNIVHAAQDDKAQHDVTGSADELKELGRRVLREGKYAEAERILRTALEKSEADMDSRGNALAEILGDLASALTSEERFAEAEQLLHRALEKRIEIGPRRTLVLLGNLGTLYELTGRYKNAEATLTEALRSADKYLGVDAPYKAVLLSNLGAVYSQSGKYKLAEKTIRKALTLAEKRFGTDSIELQPMLINLAAIHERRKNWRDAESLLLRTLSIVEDSHGPNHPEVCIVLEHLGVVHFRQGRMMDAESELRRALNIERKVGRSEGLRVASLSFNLARILSAEKKYEEAGVYYRDTLQRQEQTFGVKALEVATTLEEYARLLHFVKSEALARQMESRAKQIRAERAYTVTVDQERSTPDF